MPAAESQRTESTRVCLGGTEVPVLAGKAAVGPAETTTQGGVQSGTAAGCGI